MNPINKKPLKILKIFRNYFCQPTDLTMNLCTLALILEKKVVQKPHYFFCQIGQELFEYQHPMVQIRAPAPYHCKNYDLVHDLDGTQKLLWQDCLSIRKGAS